MPRNVEALVDVMEDATASWATAPSEERLCLFALHKMLEAGPGRFEGGMTARKYQSLTGAIKITASRDLAELAAAGLLVRQGAGRSTFYNLPMPGWAWKPASAERSRKAGGAFASLCRFRPALSQSTGMQLPGTLQDRVSDRAQMRVNPFQVAQNVKMQ
jgi:hypothetical protein